MSFRESRRVVLYSDASLFGGAEQMIVHLLAAMNRRNWTPTLVHHGGTGLKELIERCRELDIPTVEVSGGGTVRGIHRILRRLRPAIFHAHLNWAFACSDGLVAAALARSPRVIATQHLLLPIRSWRGILRHQLLSTVVDRYLAVSEHVAKILRTLCLFGERKVRVVHNGIPPGPFERPSATEVPEALVPANGRPVVLTVARLAKQKGVEHLIDAAARLPDAFFVIAGDGPERARLESKAEACGVKDRVVFLGHRRDVPDLLARCEVVVLPSLYEGLPVSMLEAMAAHKPVVATRIGGTDEAVEDGTTGLLVPPGDSEALARAIHRVLADRSLAERLGAEGRNRVRSEFSADRMASGVERVYQEALGESR